MVSSVDPKEETWNQMQRQLSNHRKSTKKPAANNKRRGPLNTNNNNNSNNNNFVPKPYSITPNNGRRSNESIRAKPPERFQEFTPLNTPPRFKATQNTNNNNNNNNDEFNLSNNNINNVYSNRSSALLPGIRSPYISARNRQEDLPNLESWGITNPVRYEDYTLYRYNPSPLLPSYSIYSKERKPYVVVPNLARRHYFDSQLTFSLDDDLHYSYIEQKPYQRRLQFSALKTRIDRAKDEYEYFKTNTAFSNQYIEEFINKTLQDQIIPDLLIEAIAAVKKENKEEKKKTQSFKDPIKDDAVDVLNTVNKNIEKREDLFNTRFIEDLEYKAKIPKRETRSVKPKVRVVNHLQEELVDEYIKTIKNEANLVQFDHPPPPARLPTPPPPEPLRHIDLKKIEIINTKPKIDVDDITLKLFQEDTNKIQENMIIERFINDDMLEPVIKKMCQDIAREVMGGYKKQIDILQNREVKKFSDERLMETFQLDHLIKKLSAHGRLVAENDDVNKLVDTMMIDILLYTQNDVRKTQSKTVDNYPLKKIHFNSFMNVALDLLVAELSESLEEDMRILDVDERKFLFT